MKTRIKIAVAILIVILFNTTPVNAALNKMQYKNETRMIKKANKIIVKRQIVQKTAKKYLGVPYIWGGFSPRGFDCSGLIRYVYAKINIFLPHNARLQYNYGKPVSRTNLQVGDLVFFSNLGHVGMYIGGGNYIHSPRSGSYVKLSRLSDRTNYYGAKRII